MNNQPELQKPQSAIWYKQLFARLTDLIILGIPLLLIIYELPFRNDLFRNGWYKTLALGISSQLVGAHELVLSLIDVNNNGKDNVLNSLLGSFVISILLGFSEYFWKGTTPGNYVFGLKARMKKENHSLNLGIALLRNFLRTIPLSIFSYIGKRPIGFHNQLCSTRTIDLYESPDRIPFFNPEMKKRFKGIFVSSSKNFKKSTKNISKPSFLKSAHLKNLTELFELKEKGAITEEEYNSLKQSILRRIK